MNEEFRRNLGVVNLSDFEYISEIPGNGLLTVTLKYQNKKDKLMYFVKKFKKNLETKSEHDSFYNEVCILKKVENPAVLSLYGYNPKDSVLEKPIIVTKFYPKTLEIYTEKNAISIPMSEKYIIILGISEGLKYLHSQNITHCDLKPANILLDDDNHPVIADFGQSKLFLQRIKSAAGTYAYMAPEIKSTLSTNKKVKKDDDQKSYDNKCDVFSFAIVFYELYTGGPAYGDIPVNQSFYINQIVNQNVRPKTENLPKIIKNFLKKCWSDKPENRPTFSEIVEELKMKMFLDSMSADIEKVKTYLSKFKESLTDSTEETSIDEIKRRADQDDIDAAIRYADIRFNMKYFDESLEYYKKAANKGDSYSKHQIAIIYEKIYNGKPLTAEAIDCIKDSIREGNYDSLLFLFDKVNYNGLKTDELFEFYKICADKGNLESIKIYANLLYDGEIAEENKNKKAKEMAAQYFEKAANLGDVESMLKLAKMYQEGDGINVDKGKITIYYKNAIAKGSPEAMLNYALYLFEYGDLHHKEIVDLLERSAKLGNVSAALFCYIIKKRALLGVSRQMKEANNYLRIAESSTPTEEEIESVFNIGSMIFRGEIKAFKIKDGVIFIKYGAEKGNGASMYYYSLILYDGEFSTKNETESISMFKKSILKGSQESMEAYNYIVNKYGSTIYNQQNDEMYKESLKYETTRSIIKSTDYLPRSISLRLLSKLLNNDDETVKSKYSKIRGIFHKLLYEVDKIRIKNNIDKNFHIISIIVISLSEKTNKEKIIQHMKEIGVNTVEGVFEEIKDAYQFVYNEELFNDSIIHNKIKEMIEDSDF